MPDHDKEPEQRPLWAQFLSRHRKLKGLTQKALGEALGVSQSTITDWERGKTRPPRDKVEILHTLIDLPRPPTESQRREMERRRKEQEEAANTVWNMSAMDLFERMYRLLFQAMEEGEFKNSTEFSPSFVARRAFSIWLRMQRFGPSRWERIIQTEVKFYRDYTTPAPIQPSKIEPYEYDDLPEIPD